MLMLVRKLDEMPGDNLVIIMSNELCTRPVDGGDTITIAIFETVMPESSGGARVGSIGMATQLAGRQGGNANGETSGGLVLMNGAVMEEWRDVLMSGGSEGAGAMRPWPCGAFGFWT
jgi:hypothetical protein